MRLRSHGRGSRNKRLKATGGRMRRSSAGPARQLFFWSAVKACSGMKRDFGDLTMKAQLILIASALLLVSNVAGAQETNAPSAGAQEQQAPTEGQDTMGHMGG